MIVTENMTAVFQMVIWTLSLILVWVSEKLLVQERRLVDQREEYATDFVICRATLLANLTY